MISSVGAANDQFVGRRFEEGSARNVVKSVIWKKCVTAKPPSRPAASAATDVLSALIVWFVWFQSQRSPSRELVRTVTSCTPVSLNT